MDKINAKKKFGQNFIRDQKLINRIVNLLGDEKDSLVIEIGPGTGALTKELVKRFNHVVAIEIDEEMGPILTKNINSKNFELIIGDVLLTNLKEIIQRYKTKKCYLISNTPYYITSEILFQSFQLSSLLDKAVFMMQKEVALRVCAKVNEPDYNNLSIATEFYADRKYEFTVNKGMFNPIPKVDSAIVSLTFNDQYKHQVQDETAFLNFVRSLFNNKRKTILNNLGRVLDNKQEAKTVLTSLKIRDSFRPENLTLQDYLNIFVKIK